MPQSPHDLTAAFPSDAQAAVSSCFLCHTHTSASTTRGAGRGSGSSVSVLLVAAQLFSCPERQEQRGQDAPLGTPLFARAAPFSAGQVSALHARFQMEFCSSSSFLALGLCVPTLLVPLLIVQRDSEKLLIIVPEFHNCNKNRLCLTMD